MNFVSMDLETTGLSAAKDRIVEIGATDGARTFSRLINPGCPIPKAASDINGITDDMVKEASDADRVLPELLEFIGDATLLAHNAPFDVSFLAAAFQRARLPLPKNVVIDTYSAAKVAHPGWMKYNLQHLVVMLDLPRTAAHRALGDAESALALWETCRKELVSTAYDEFFSDPGFDGHGAGCLTHEKILDSLDMRRSWLRALQEVYGSGAPQIELERLFHGESRRELVELFGLCVETNRFKKTHELHLMYSRKDGRENTIPLSKLTGLKVPIARQARLFSEPNAATADNP